MERFALRAGEVKPIGSLAKRFHAVSLESVFSTLFLAACYNAIHEVLDPRLGPSLSTVVLLGLALLVLTGFGQPFASKLKDRKVPWRRRRFLAISQLGLTIAVGLLTAWFFVPVLGWTQDLGSQLLLIGLVGLVLYTGAMAFVRSLEWIAQTKEVLVQLQCTVCGRFGSLLDEQENRQQELPCQLTEDCPGTMKPVANEPSMDRSVTTSAQGDPESREASN